MAQVNLASNSISSADNTRNLASGNEQFSSRGFGANAVLVMAAVVVVMFGLQQISSVFGPVFFALTLVLSLLPINRWMIRHKVPSFVAILITITVMMSTLLLFVGLLVLSLWGLPDLVYGYRDELTQIYLNSLSAVTDLANQFGIDPNTITGGFRNFNVDRVLSFVSSMASSLSSVGSALLTLLLSLFFLVIDTVSSAASPDNPGGPSGLAKSIRNFERSVRQYWIVTTFFGFIVAVLCGIALVFLKVPGAITWGVVAFVTNYIPNLGFVIGVIPPMLVGLLEGGWTTAAAVFLAYSLLNFVIQSLIQPKVTGDAVGLNTSTTFLSLLIWSIVIGPLGAILAVPLTLFFKAILVDSDPRAAWLNRYLQSPGTLRKQKQAQESEDHESLLAELGFTWQSGLSAGEIKERFRSSEMRLGRSLSGKFNRAKQLKNSEGEALRPISPGKTPDSKNGSRSASAGESERQPRVSGSHPITAPASSSIPAAGHTGSEVSTSGESTDRIATKDFSASLLEGASTSSPEDGTGWPLVLRNRQSQNNADKQNNS